VTRHGRHPRNHSGAAATTLRLTALAVPNDINRDLMASCDHQFSTRNRRASRQSRNNPTPQTRRADEKTIPTFGQ